MDKNMHMALKRQIESSKHHTKQVAPLAKGHNVNDEDQSLTDAQDLHDAKDSDRAPTIASEGEDSPDQIDLGKGDAHGDANVDSTMHAHHLKLLEAMASHSGHGSLSARAGDKARLEIAAIKGKNKPGV